MRNKSIIEIFPTFSLLLLLPPLAKFFNLPMPNDCLALQSLHTVILNVVAVASVVIVIVVVSGGVDIVNFYH